MRQEKAPLIDTQSKAKRSQKRQRVSRRGVLPGWRFCHTPERLSSEVIAGTVTAWPREAQVTSRVAQGPDARRSKGWGLLALPHPV